MIEFTLRRLGAALLLLYLVLTATFFIVHLAPGEPAKLFMNPRISEEQRQQMRQVLGLDRSLGRQYLAWMGAALRGDWGTSFSFGRPATDLLRETMPATCLLVAGVALVEYGLGVSLGLWAAARAGGRLDRLARVLSLFFYAMPSFWLALIAIEILTVRWQLFPTNQMTSDTARYLPLWGQALDLLHHLVLPALALGLVRCGAVVRFVRNGMLEVLQQDYIRTARAKGLRPARVLWVHALRNAIIPIVQRLGFTLPALLSGAVIIEVIFSWPGVGQLVYMAMLQRDYPLILAATALSAALVILGNLGADLLHAWLDPRVRHAR